MRRAKGAAGVGVGHSAVTAATTGLLLLASPPPQSSTTTPPPGTCSGQAASPASIGDVLIEARDYGGRCSEDLFLPTVVSAAERDADDVWATDSHASSPQAGVSNRKRELNKIAARKCRLRRKEKALVAQKEVDELQARNTQLRFRVADLEQCKQQLLELVRTHCHIRLEDAV